jgi:hypothetical protein
MFTYQNKEYGSKAEVVRSLYDQGKITLNASDKKRVADEIGMTIQTVHATLVKYIGGGKVSTLKEPKAKKITPAVEQATNRLKQKMGRVLSSEDPIFIRDKSDEVQEELMSRKDKIVITNAPNQWGMPVVEPPLYVIDPNYDPDWIPPPDESVEKLW